MYTVLDFEFNQAFDFDHDPTILDTNCRFEIIQIGAVKLDENLNIVDKINLLIKPEIYMRMHPYVEKITGLTMNMLNDKPGFKEAFNTFLEFIGDNKTLCVWGKSDIRALYRNLTYHNIITPPILIKYVDIQQLTTQKLKYSRGGTIGLKNAVELLQLPIYDELTFHDALADAIYTAQVFKALNLESITIKLFNSNHIKDNTQKKK